MKNFLDSVVAHPVGAFILLTLAAFLEAFGDSLFQSGLYRSAGAARGLFFVLRRGGSRTLRIYGQHSPLGFWQTAGSLCGAVFPGGPGVGQGPVPPGAHHTHLRRRDAYRDGRNHHRVLAR